VNAVERLMVRLAVMVDVDPYISKRGVKFVPVIRHKRGLPDIPYGVFGPSLSVRDEVKAQRRIAERTNSKFAWSKFDRWLDDRLHEYLIGIGYEHMSPPGEGESKPRVTYLGPVPTTREGKEYALTSGKPDHAANVEAALKRMQSEHAVVFEEDFEAWRGLTDWERRMRPELRTTLAALAARLR
jgi:hypothetical protein